MVGCAAQGCRNQVGTKPNCYECGKPHCEKHLKMHERCMKAKICPSPKCWGIHTPWCRKHLRHLGPLPVMKTLGKGRECVYVWYTETDFKAAKRSKKAIWLCKIGRTKGTPSGRTLSVARTAHSGTPIVPLTFQTDDSRKLESLIHAALTYAGRHELGALGKEWFRTNPTEIETIYRELNRVIRSFSSRR
jgi:hypothetical protein